jgi:hypothetical protein
MAELKRHLAWYKAQHLIGETIEARDVVDPGVVAGR